MAVHLYHGTHFHHMRALLLVATLLLTACSRTPSLEGEYLSEREFLRVFREDGELVLDLHSREFTTRAPRRLATVKLAPAGDGAYSGTANMGFLDGPLTVTRTERGVLLTGDGKPREAVRVDLDHGASRFGTEDAAALLLAQFVDTGARLAEERQCKPGRAVVLNPEYGISEPRLAHVQQVLSKARVRIDATEKQEGVLQDRYTLRGALVLPELQRTVRGQRHCKSLLYELTEVEPSCTAWGSATVVTESTAREVPFELMAEVTRFPGQVNATPRLEWRRLGGREAVLEVKTLCQELLAPELHYQERFATPAGAPAAQ